MTERKPPGMSVQDWVDLQVRQAQERGEFDNLAGAGKPIPKLAQPHDPDWWVKDFIRRENIEADALLPPSVQLRKEKSRLPERVAGMRTEDEVRAYVTELNERIRLQIRDTTGTVVPVGLMDEEAAVATWRENRPAPRPKPAAEVPEERPARRSIWQRLFS